MGVGAGGLLWVGKGAGSCWIESVDLRLGLGNARCGQEKCGWFFPFLLISCLTFRTFGGFRVKRSAGLSPTQIVTI